MSADNDEQLKARLDAIEIMLFAIVQQLQARQFVADLTEQKELAVTALLNAPATDARIQRLEIVIARYLAALNLSP